jgi:TRAP-type C4-dicarboxylate transport system substrate-binding protein
MAALAATLAAGPRQSPAVVIRLGTAVPANSPWDRAVQVLAGEWSRLSSGAVTLRPVHGPDSEGTLVRKLRADALEAASLSTSGLSEIDPAFNVLALPWFYESDASLERALGRVMPILRSKAESRGFVLVELGVTGWIHMFSKTSIRSVSDLQAQTVAAPGVADATVAWYHANGLTVTSVAVPDVVTALESGRATAVPATPYTAVGFNWFRAAPHMQSMRTAPLVVGTVVTRKIWDRIAPDVRRRLLEAAATSDAAFLVESGREDDRSVAAMQGRGLMVDGPSSLPAGEWRDFAGRLAASARGGLVPSDVFDAAAVAGRRGGTALLSRDLP